MSPQLSRDKKIPGLEFPKNPGSKRLKRSRDFGIPSPGCQIFILCEIHCYWSAHIFWVHYFSLSQCGPCPIWCNLLWKYVFCLFSTARFISSYLKHVNLFYQKNRIKLTEMSTWSLEQIKISRYWTAAYCLLWSP